MDNVLDTQGIPLTVFGGAVTEMAPEDLPEGASPFSQDVDYSPGSVFTRGGRTNQIVYSNLFLERIAGVASSIPGQFAPNEVAWGTPTNATLGIPGTYAIASLNSSLPVGTPYSVSAALSGSPAFNPTNWASMLAFFKVAPGKTAQVLQVNTGNYGVGLTFGSPITAGSSIIVLSLGQNLFYPNPKYDLSCSDTASNPYTYVSGVQNVGGVQGTNPQADLLYSIGVPGGTPTITTTAISHGGTPNGATVILEVTNLIGLDSTGTHTAYAGSDSVSATATQGGDWPVFWASAYQGEAFTVTSPGFIWVASGGAGREPEVAFPSSGGLPYAYSQILKCSNFNLTIPLTQKILGFQVEIFGNQSSTNADCLISATPFAPSAASPTLSGKLPAVDGTPLVLGTPTTNWGLALTPALLNDPNFAIDIVASAIAGSLVTFNVYAVKLKVWLSPATPANVNWLKTYEQTNAQVDTLALDSNGILYDEQVNYGAGPGILNSIFLNILPNSFVKGVTFDDVEYMAFSNLINGTDIPRQWNGTNLDRVSMCGPGAAPQAIAQSANQTIVSITQAASTQIRRIAWGASANAINDSTPGNILVIFGEGRTGSNTYATLPNAVVGGTIVLSGIPTAFPKKGGGTIPYNINGTYTILQVTTAVVGGGEICPVFTVQAPAIAYGYSSDFGFGGIPTSGWFYQATLATMTTSAQVPNLSVGNQFQITGTGGSPPAGYDGTWTVLGTPNGAQLQITSTQLNGGIATYSYIVVSGTNPVSGQYITVTNTLNGNGIFNVQNVTITAASGSGGVGTGGSFSLSISGANINPAAENGSGIIFGTLFTFEPGQLVGNKTGGSLASQGLIGVGIRKLCYSFLTRTGQTTQPSPIATFNVLAGSGSIVVSGLLPGPSNVVARIIHFTGANGGNFFNLPQPVTVISNGTPQVSNSTWVNDNTTTSVTLSFADGVLLTGTAIDIPGNNLFADLELGSSRGFLTYSQRMIAWSEQNKITNLRNLSFDGGLAGANQGGGVTTTYPAGWTVDPNLGGGESLVNSPVFGFAVQIQNTSGITQSTYGMLTQPAYLDEFLVPIIQSATTYSVRVTASCPTGAAGGNLVVDLFSPSFNQSFGTFSIPLASMTSIMAIYTGTLLTSPFAQVPKDLVIRMYATSIANLVTVLVDRCEPFPTLQPVLSTQMKSSYALAPEQFDLQTGVLGPAQNQQPINGALTMYDLLYCLKERSWYSTSDNGVTEPFKWNWKEVSQKVGTIGINSYDYGEGWALTANREGVFFFEGGEPIKVSQEIQPLWDLINWNSGASIWLRNDPEQKRFTIGVPIPTPNAYMPEFPVNAAPTTPNVVLMCNYRELNTGAMMASTGPIRSTFSGRLMSPEPARKWSFWNILCPYSDYIDRSDNNWPQWFGTGYADSKIFALSASTLSDDGNAINSFYVTYGFVKPEMADAKGLGLFRMQFDYLTILAVGSGTLNTYVYPEAPANQPYTLDQAPLPAVSAGDLELGVNIKGQRFFVRLGTNSVGSAWRLSKMVVALSQDSWSPVRGLTSAAL